MRRNPFWTPYLKITRIWRPLIEINKARMKPSVDSFKLVFIAFECKRFPAVSGNLSTSIRRVLKTSFVFSAFFALASKRVLVFFTQKNTLQDGETIKLRVFMRTTKRNVRVLSTRSDSWSQLRIGISYLIMYLQSWENTWTSTSTSTSFVSPVDLRPRRCFSTVSHLYCLINIS